ncbi:hypothetical protein LCGC14_0176260 [marine sediment metagenome]|uniref:Uncharacterized protein n=1 Tax=marine sediment metagenome TaxID=412755 RepID=A0A0F9V7Q8_9ZZZZ
MTKLIKSNCQISIENPDLGILCGCDDLCEHGICPWDCTKCEGEGHITISKAFHTMPPTKFLELKKKKKIIWRGKTYILEEAPLQEKKEKI